MTFKNSIEMALSVVLLSAVLACFAPRERAYAKEELFSPEEKEFIESLDALKVGYVPDRVPISYTDKDSGELSGASRMIFDRIQKISGLKFIYCPLPQGSISYKYLSDNGFDLVTNVEYNEENLNARGICLSRPYLLGRKVIIGHEGVAIDPDKNLKIAVVTGSQTVKDVLKKQYPNFEIISYDTIEECFEAVNNDGDADFLIQNQYVAEHQMSKPQYTHLKILPAVGLDDKLCFSAVVPIKGSASKNAAIREKEQIISIINKAISQISEDDVANYIMRADMENQYHDAPADFFYRYRYPAIFLLASLVALAVMVCVLIRSYIRTLKMRADAEAKRQFLSMMSHEIRTPLNGLLGLNYLASQNLSNEDRAKKYLRQSSDVAKYLMTLVNDILDASKLQRRQIQIEKKPFLVEDMLAMAGSVAEGKMKEKNIDYSVEKNISYPCLVGDEIRAEQVLINMLDNAYKFTPNGGSVRLSVSQKKGDDGRISTRLSVSDTGCGITEEFQKVIFDSFAQERKSVSAGNQGVGLGMAISRDLAKLMDGDLTVESTYGKGSTFHFTFMADCAEETEPAARSAKEPEEQNPSFAKNILVAEDNDINAEIMTDLLEDEGYAVTLAVNGKEAVDIFSASAPGTYKYILMDIMMPVKDGFAATRDIRALNRSDARDVKIIACTANAFEEDMKKAFESGMDDFVAKPVDMDSLLEKLGGE